MADAADRREGAARVNARHASDRDERYATRLESFGDIVIGFSLAQLALSFSFGPHLDGRMLSGELTAFFWTFAMTAWLWLLYRRIGEDYFVPRASMVALHMVGLAGIVLLIFGVQLVMHYGTPPAPPDEAQIAVVFYFVVLALTLAACGTQFAVGAWMRRGSIDPETSRRGKLTAYRLIAMAVCVLATAAVLPLHGMAATVFLLPSMAGGSIIGRLVGSFALRRSVPG